MAVVAAVTDKGDFREKNEDALLARVAETPFGEVGLLVCCDGVGGLPGGEVASATVAAAFDRWFDLRLPTVLSRRVCGLDASLADVRREWEGLLGIANEGLWRRGSEAGLVMGTTCSAVMAAAGSCIVAQVGDSRAYAADGSGVRLLTSDQTVGARSTGDGAVRFSSALAQAVGAQEAVRPVITTHGVGEDVTLVAMTDGMWRTQGKHGPAQLRKVAEESGEKALLHECERLVRSARRSASGTTRAWVACRSARHPTTNRPSTWGSGRRHGRGGLPDRWEVPRSLGDRPWRDVGGVALP